MTWEIEKPKTSIEVLASEKLSYMMRELASYTKDEFILLFKTEYVEGEWIIDDDSIYLPKQEMEYADAEIKDDGLDFSQYNSIIHRHPDGCLSFSATDWARTNCNYEFSFLWTQKEGFCDGVSKITDKQGNAFYVKANLVMTIPQYIGKELYETQRVKKQREFSTGNNASYSWMYMGLYPSQVKTVEAEISNKLGNKRYKVDIGTDNVVITDKRTNSILPFNDKAYQTAESIIDDYAFKGSKYYDYDVGYGNYFDDCMDESLTDEVDRKLLEGRKRKAW